MIKILFVCHGNICRSPMAEFILKKLLKENNINDVIVVSKATSNEEIGNDLYYLAKEKLIEKKIPFTKHEAKRITKDDYQKYDYIYGMDNENIYNMMNIFINDKDKKIKLLNGIISDPWYTRDFEKTYNQIYEGCINIINNML